MCAATMQSVPVIPPRPARGQDKDGHSNAPMIPARPTKKLNHDRSVSPNPARFAQSPLNESPFGSKKRNSQSFLGNELERTTSVDMPGVGEEGQEYAVALERLDSSSPEVNRGGAVSPEQTRMVGEDVKLHAPKPTVPASSAKQRVATVTRTDSDRAAAFGIGRPSNDDPFHGVGRTLKKKASTTSQLSHHSELFTDDEHGIPEIGQRVPMLSYAGDVQAPSPAPPRAPSVDSTKSTRHHTRRTSSRSGFHDLPPGSYGLHGHGVESTDKLEKAYYEKHPDVYQKEHYQPLHERANDYSMSRENLNKIVRETANRGVGFGTSGYAGTPSEQIGYQASDEYTSRMSTPQPNSSGPKAESVKLPSKSTSHKEPDVIHVDEEAEKSAEGLSDDDGAYPILAPDEVAKDPSSYELRPAVPPTRRGSDDTRSRPSSRPSSRPASIYSPPPPEMHSTPLADVEEYEPLFPEDDKGDEKPKTQSDKFKEPRRRFPSQDIWEDAPNSVHSTAEVSTPEPTDVHPKSRAASLDLPRREAETPAQAFARRQEELAEKEALTPDSFTHRQQRPHTWVDHQSHLSKDIQGRPGMNQRFPSRDIWEDTPDSLQFTTTVSQPQSTDDSVAEEGNHTTADANLPSIPARRPKKQGSGDDGTSKPVIPERPKSHVPARPSKLATESQETDETTKQRPAVPPRPVGGKIAALQAGFMSDLNKRLRLGPQAPKRDASPVEDAPEEQEKTPLTDARKGRARGPQRRAPTKSPNPVTGTEKSVPPSVHNGHPVLSFSMTRTLWSIDEEGTVTVDSFGSGKNQQSELTVTEVKPEEAEAEEPKVEESKPEEAPAEGTVAAEMETGQASEQEGSESKSEGLEKKVTDDEPGQGQDTTEVTKTLATNTAGESILEETVEKKEDGGEIKEVEKVKDEVIS